ncbi:MAG: MFS transporter [Candidatus Thorarchaeota archaeon]
MDQKNENLTRRSKGYFRYLLIILMFVLILDNYTQFYSAAIPSKVAEEFLGSYPINVANSIYTFAISITTLGSYIVFFIWYLSDKIGRKFLLVLSVFGMAAASLGILLSRTIVEYTIFRLFLTTFVGSDIWLIYLSEESPSEKRAFWTNIPLIGGMIGILLMAVFRSIFITETSPVGAWRGMTYFSIIVGIPLGIIVLTTIKETSKYEDLKKDLLTRERSHTMKENFKIIFKSDNKKAYFAVLIIAFLWSLNSVYYSLAELYLAESPYLTESGISIVILILVPSIAGGFLTTGILADKVGRKPLLYAFVIIFSIGALIFLFGTNISGIALILACVGQSMINIAIWGSWVLISIITTELVPTNARGTGTGLKSLMGTIAGTTSLLVTSIMTYYFSLFVLFILFLILLQIIIPVVYKFMIETKGVELRSSI